MAPPLANWNKSKQSSMNLMPRGTVMCVDLKMRILLGDQ